MNKLQQSFAEFRKSMPVGVQWLLLAAAFLVVVILLVILLSGPSKKPAPVGQAPLTLELTLNPTAAELTDVPAGDTRVQEIKVGATSDAKIIDVVMQDKPDSMNIKTTCKKGTLISNKLPPCTITLDWTPVAAQPISTAKIFITYHAANQSPKMQETATVPVTLSAAAAKQKPVQTAVAPNIVEKKEQPKSDDGDKDIAPAPAAPTADIPPFIEPEPDIPEPIDFDVGEVIDFDFQEPTDFGDMNPDRPIDDEEFIYEESIYEEPAPWTIPELPPVTEPFLPLPAPFDAEGCYEFAFAGFDMSGRQSGWIRAENGRYMFHPFSDKDCSSPTGEYNPNTGLIYDIKNPSKTIGSDAEHIGGRGIGANLAMPALSPAPTQRTVAAGTAPRANAGSASIWDLPRAGKAPGKPMPSTNRRPSSFNKESTVSSEPYDRTFVLRQFKPIPATIVNEVRADPKNMSKLPVQATIDRHVYSDNGRTIILPAGTLMLGYATGDLPGPYKAIGRMSINWYRFVRPDGVEFNFVGPEPFSADSQGRVGVPGHGTTDYIESMIMPMMTAIVPAAVNLIAPISDRFVNQIDLDNNTVTQSGQVRSSELAKQEIISTWNRVVQKLAIDMLDNTTPPFSIAAGTRITVFSPTDLIVTCGKGIYDEGGTDTRNCAISAPNTDYATARQNFEGVAGPGFTPPATEDWIGQVRSLQLLGVVREDGTIDTSKINDPRLQEFFRQTNLYQGKTQAAYNTYYQNLSNQGGITTPTGTVLAPGSKEYNEQILGLKYNEAGTQIQNPFLQEPKAPAVPVLLCPDTQTPPDAFGCCAGEVFDTTVISPDTPEGACCPSAGGDCFPPIK